MLTALAVAAYLVIATLTWVSLRKLRTELVPEPGPGEGVDRLTVVVAVHNEAPRVGGFLATLLEQDHPEFEVIVADDRSTDGTREVAERHAAGDPRVRFVRIDERPEGWQGRLWALGIGAEQATGEWILFLSADQRLRSRTFLRAMVSTYGRSADAAISVVGPFGGRRWWDRLWLDLFANSPLVWGSISLIRAYIPGSIWLIGALGIRRRTYRELGGVSAAALCGGGAFDDFGWARALSRAQRSGRMVYHRALEDISNWETFPEFWQGVTRWVAGVFTYRRGGWLVACLCFAALAIALGGPIALFSALADARPPGPGAIALTAILPTIGLAHSRWNRRSPLFVLWFYPGAAVVLAMLVGGAWARLRNRVVWRGEEIRVVLPPQ